MNEKKKKNYCKGIERSRWLVLGSHSKGHCFLRFFSLEAKIFSNFFKNTLTMENILPSWKGQ